MTTEVFDVRLLDAVHVDSCGGVPGRREHSSTFMFFNSDTLDTTDLQGNQAGRADIYVDD